MEESTCPVLPPLPFTGPEDPRDLTNNEISIAGDLYGGQDVYGRAAQFEGERSLYRKMKNNSSLLGQEGAVNQFYYSADTGVIGRLYEIDRRIAALGQVSGEDQSILNQMEAIIDSLIAGINIIDGLYSSAPTAADSLDLQNQKKALLETLLVTQQNRQTLSDSIDGVGLSQIPAIIALNANIVSENTLVTNRKTINRIFLETVALGKNSATEGQLDDLLAVASQCFLEGGDAVLSARALYALLDQPLDIDDALICGGQGQGRILDVDEKAVDNRLNITVVPNPAKDHITIQAQEVAQGSLLHVQIIDLNGKLLKDLTIQNGVTISHNFSPGVYFCRVSVGNEPEQVVKFIIIP